MTRESPKTSDRRFGRRGVLWGAAAFALTSRVGWTAPLPPVWPAPTRLAARLLPLLIKPGVSSRALSPLSLAAALQLLAVGARGGSEVALNDLLGGEGDADHRAMAARAAFTFLTAAHFDGVIFQHALAGWARNGEFATNFADTARNRLGAALGRLPSNDSDAVALINKWVDGETSGGIKELITALDPAATFVLTSALDFRAPWTEPFDPVNTVLRPFYAKSGTPRLVQTVHRERMAVTFAASQGCHAVRIPYGHGRFGALLVTSASVERLNDLTALLTRPTALADVAAWGFVDRVMSVAIPKFSLETEADFIQDLTALGVASAFADRMDYRELLKPPSAPSALIQRVRLAVDEAGTVAVAATAVVGTRSIQPEPSGVFTLDRPFLMVIEDRETRYPLVMAHVAEVPA